MITDTRSARDKPTKKNRRTVNLTQGVWEMVLREAQIEFPDEILQISMTTRVLLREAINARRIKRGEKPVVAEERPRRR